MVKIYTRVLSEVEKAAVAGLTQTAREVLKASQALVPVDDGTLRKSGRVIISGLDVAVRYSAGHAWLQHERLDWQHLDGGQAKYLDAALDQVGVAGMMVANIKAAFGGG